MYPHVVQDGYTASSYPCQKLIQELLLGREISPLQEKTREQAMELRITPVGPRAHKSHESHHENPLYEKQVVTPTSTAYSLKQKPAISKLTIFDIAIWNTNDHIFLISTAC